MNTHNEITVEDVKALHAQKIVYVPKLKKVTKEQKRQQILPGLTEQIEEKATGQKSLFW